MIAENNTVMYQAVSSVSQLTEDKRIRDEIWRREDNARIERTNKNAYEQATIKIAQLEEEKKTITKEKDAVIEEKDVIIAEMRAEIERLKKEG